MRVARWLLKKQARSGLAIAVLVCGAGLTVSANLGGTLAEQRRVVARAQFDRQADVATVDVTNAVRRYLDTLQTVAGAWGAFEEPTAAKFARTTQPIADMRLPGVTSVVYLVPSATDSISAVQRTWRARGAPELTLRPSGSEPEHIFSIFNTVLDGHTLARSGIDVTQSPPPTRALLEARRTGRATISDPYQLIIDQALPADARQQSFSLTVPVYRQRGASGPRRFDGWVLMGLRGRDFISATLRQVAQGLVDISLSAPHSNGTEQLVAAEQEGADGRRDLTDEIRIPVADRYWVLRLAAVARQLPGAGSPAAASTVGPGAALSLLLGGLIYILVTAHRRAEEKVERATGDLAAAAQDLAAARDDLIAHKAYLTEILDAIDVAVMTCDADGTIVHTNTYARRLLPSVPGPLTATDAAGALQLRRTDGTPLPAEQSPMTQALRGRFVSGLELVLSGPDRTPLTYMLHARPLHDNAGNLDGAVTAAVNISVLREQEAELKAFAGVVAHDLRAPLSSVAGYAEIVRDDILAGAPAVELDAGMTRIQAGVDRMRHLIDDLLTLAIARDAPLRMAPVDLHMLTEDVVAERTAHLSATPTRTLLPQVSIVGLPTVQADPTMLRRLLDNLIGNALKYTRPDEPARIEISAFQDPGERDRIHVRIADRGIGIPAADQPHVFTTFHRSATHRDYSGTGLGLAICHRIVHRHGGTIEVADNPGGGTRMTFSLPHRTRVVVPVS